MTGPPYPPSPSAGSNPIGSFVIGTSPIGDLPAFSIWATVLSEYANSPTLSQIIQDMDVWIDPTAEIDTFFDDIFNISTAVGYGLDVWGRILNVGRAITLIGTQNYVGFNEGNYPSFNSVYPFYVGAPANQNALLSDANYRGVLLAKAAANICNGSITAINAIMLALFPHRGACYVVDGGNLTMELQFTFPLTAIEQAIVTQTGVIPIPAGVAATLVLP